MANWNIDGGLGADDYAAFISSQGEVALYKGTDPASSTTWALQGVYWLGSPIGRRCFVQYGSDVAVISQDGLLASVQGTAAEPHQQQSRRPDRHDHGRPYPKAITSYGANFGWQVIPFPGENMLLLNVPVAVGSQYQWAMNTINGSWWKFTGWAANCFELFGDELYYGGNGTVFQGVARALLTRERRSASRSFPRLTTLASRRPSSSSRWSGHLLALGNNAAFSFGINTDFDTTQPLGVPTYTPTTAGKWDSGLWDVATWGGDPVIQKNWQTVSGVGYCACPAHPWFYFGRSDRVERVGFRLQGRGRALRRICTGHGVTQWVAHQDERAWQLRGR
jgi:hypothetical protein